MRVIVGVDGTEASMEALEEATRLTEEPTDLTVAVYSADDSTASSITGAVRHRLDELEIDVSLEELTGDPGSELVQRAETGDYDRIVMPGGTRSPLGKVRFDDVLEFVVLNAQTTVTLVR